MKQHNLTTKERELYHAEFVVYKMMTNLLKVGARAAERSAYPEAWTSVLAPIFNSSIQNQKFGAALMELGKTLEQIRDLEFRSREIVRDVVEQAMHKPNEY